MNFLPLKYSALHSILLSMLLCSTQFAHAKELSDSDQDTSDASEIINGSAGLTATYPWMAFIADEVGFQYCGASLISPTWVLTAAHCFLNEIGDAVDIETGANSVIVLNSDTSFPFANEAVVGQIGQIIIHPSYNPDPDTSNNVDDFDLALVELTAAVDLTPVSLLSANTPEIAAGTQARILGWGATAVGENNEGINASEFLLTATQAMTSSGDCAMAYPNAFTANMVCANGVNASDTTDTCQGDSGGPLAIVKDDSFVQVGVVSFGGTETGPACGDPNAPGVYTSVAALASFIGSNTTEVTFTSLDAATAAPVLETRVVGSTVTLSWTAYQGASGYTLYYAPFPEQTPIASANVGALTSLAAELPAGSSFYVAIQPYNEAGPIEVFSNIATFVLAE